MVRGQKQLLFDNTVASCNAGIIIHKEKRVSQKTIKIAYCSTNNGKTFKKFDKNLLFSFYL